jgi:arylsulfatase A-like enzyme
VQRPVKSVRKALRRFQQVSSRVIPRLRQAVAVIIATAFVFSPIVSGPLGVTAQAAPRMNPSPAGGAAAGGGCALKSAHGDIQHVIYIQFDNVHFTRDNPNVPSDLEQIPNLLNFLTDNGTFSDNEHTPLKSHTADDIITSLTGVYGDRHGQSIANSFDYFDPSGVPHFTSSFEYWTDIVSAKNDDRPYMITASGNTAPAPWVPFTRAGCNVGAVSTANMEFENVFGDISTAFANDPAKLMRAQIEVKTNFDGAVADYEGIATHCAAGNAVCSAANGGVANQLSQEPGGYAGFNALYGNHYVAPVISPNGPLKDLDGVVISDTDSPPNVGFPGFDPSAAQSLAYVAAMQEHGVPVTYAYIADVHDNHNGDWINAPAECLTDPDQGALGPGNECYEAQLAAYNEAFGKFFARLKADGIDKHNTLFIITADEGDHFAGGPPSPANCTGQNGNFCSYAKIGEIDSNMRTLINNFDPGTVSQAFDIQFDDAPVFYLNGQPAVGSPIAREFERDAAQLTAVSPITGNTDQLTIALSDPVGMKLLYMITGDPQRDPTFVMWGNADWFWELSGPIANENPGFAWNHGGIQKEVVTTWLGLVGPGVKNDGIRHDVWSDHTDIRPTILVLTGLTDDYQSEGRTLVEFLQNWALPDGVSDSSDEFVELARAFKKINAPNAELGRTSLIISTRALASGSPGNDSTYFTLENELSNITTLRDNLASRMSQKLDAAEFHGQRISESDERELTSEAEGLLDVVRALAQ